MAVYTAKAALVEGITILTSLMMFFSTGFVPLVAGGVGANLALRAQLDAAAAKRKARVFYPELELCTDNGAMIAFAGALRFAAGETVESAAGRFAVRPRWSLQDIRPPRVVGQAD